MITSNEQFKKIVDDRNKYVSIQMSKKLKSGISHKDFRKMYELVDDLLQWEYERMSSSGKETIDEIGKILGI